MIIVKKIYNFKWGKNDCCVLGCRPQGKTGCFLFPGPKTMLNLLYAWLKLIFGTEDIGKDLHLVYKNLGVCSDHFSTEDVNQAPFGFNFILKKAVA